MESTWDFLLALGLDETAGVREVRRAYARRLKAIDPALDPGGFQALREAYEMALEWAEYRAREQEEAREDRQEQEGTGPEAVEAAAGEAVDAPCLDKAPQVRVPAAVAPVAAIPSALQPQPQPEPDPHPEPEQPEQPILSPADQLASTAFERLCQDAVHIIDSGRLGEPQAWLAALQARLMDEELDSIPARALFEECVVQLLANGWQRGHEALFPAAVAAFDWSADRRRLAQFGYAGHVLNQAIDERALFDTQPPVLRAAQERVAMLLRHPEPASDDDIFRHMGALEDIEQRFPTLLAVVADTGKTEYWHQAYAERYVEGAASGTSTRERLSRWFVYLLLFIAFFFALNALYNGSKPSPLLRSDQLIREAGAEVPPPSPELLLSYLAPLHYTPARAGRLSVTYDVYLLEDGSVNATDMIDPSSGDPAFDMAVAQAILDAKPFPKEVPRVFRISYTGESTYAPEKPAPQQKVIQQTI